MRFSSSNQRKAVFSRLARENCSQHSRDQLAQLRDSMFSKKSVSKIEAVGGGLSEIYVEPKLLRNEDKKSFKFIKLSKRPQEIGSVWVGGGFVHGPRIRQPGEFEFIKNVEPSSKFFHFKDADKIPSSLPKGSKLVVGKLRKSGEWALQSTIIPKTSKLGRSLINKKEVR